METEVDALARAHTKMAACLFVKNHTLARHVANDCCWCHWWLQLSISEQ